jgi:hypothetical protein
VKALEAGSTVKAVLKHPDNSTAIIGIEENIPSGGLPSTFNSFGPNFEMDLKPQLSAPDGGILSTMPVNNDSSDNLSGWGVMSGISQATTFVAGLYALIAQARGTMPDPRLFENLLASTAEFRRCCFCRVRVRWSQTHDLHRLYKYEERITFYYQIERF